jgi:hypothetical protein
MKVVNNSIAIGIPAGRRLTKRRRAGSILVRQCPARLGTFLDEAI